MLIAQVKLPVAIERGIFDKLSKEFECIKEEPGKRVYESKVYDYDSANKIEVCLMSSNNVYEDECEKTADGGYTKDGQGIESYYVCKRPTTDYVVLKDRLVILDVEKFYSFTSQVGLEIVRHIPITVPNSFESYKLLEKTISDLTERLDTFANNNFSFNQKCDVHVPNLGLLQIQTVTYEVDCCTEHLQEMLEQGWRIIAACPQPDQRRPDYILGKTEKSA